MTLELKRYKGPRGTVFYATGTVDGRRINRSTGHSDRNLARKRLLEIELEAASPATSSSTPPLSDCLALYLGRPGSVGATSRAYVSAFVTAHASHTLDAVTPSMVIAHCQASPSGKPKAPATIRREINAVQAFLNYCRDLSDLQPLRIKKPSNSAPKATKFSCSERDRLLATIRRHAPWYYPHVLTYFVTGLRRSELVNLTWDDVLYDEDDNPSVILIRSRKGSTGRVIERRIPLHKVLVPHFREMERVQRPGPSDRVFRNSLGKPISCPSLINKVLRPLLERAGLSHLTTHDMRRTFASELLAAEVSDHRISDLLGHIDLKMLKTYGIIEDNLRKDAVSRLPGLD